MADLTDIQAAESIKIIGSTSAGVETTPVASSLLGELATADVITGAGVEGAISVGTSSIEAKVGGAALTNRKSLTILNNSGNTIYWGRTTSVTTSTGTPIISGQLYTFSFSDTAPVYLIAGSTSNDARITESI